LNLEKLVKYSLPVFVIAIISRAFEQISFLYFAVPVMCVVYIAYSLWDVKSQKLKVKEQKHNSESDHNLLFNILPLPSLLFLLPGMWFLLTSLWSSYPIISAERALYFILLSGGCLAAGSLWQRFSSKGFLDFLIPANIIVVLICLFSLITNIPSDSWIGGNGKGFMGFFGHQNLLASIILFTLPAVIFRIAIRTKSSIRKFNLYFLLLAFNFLLLILTYSRASMLSLLFGVSIYLILNKKWKIILYTFAVFAILSAAIYITPSLKNLTENIINKDFPEFYTSRMWMWEPSYRAALDGGLIGLGYGISDPNEKVGGAGDHFEGDRFVREKGNSTLALIEEAGLIGLVLFLVPIVFVFKKFRIYNLEFRMNKNNNSTLYIILSSLAAMLLHAQFEGWWVGVGSVQLPLFFVYLGLLVRSSMTNAIK
jgi:O-antigen ligase